MKPLYILIIVVIAAGAFWYFWNASEPTIPADTTDDTEIEITDSTTGTDDTNVVESDSVSTETDTSIGTDVGMEFPDVDANARVFNITGESFRFNVSEIRVQEGDTVTINFTSVGGFHDWVIDEFDAAAARVNTDGTSSVTFVADQKGTFEYYCSVGQHRANGMVGTLIVE